MILPAALLLAVASGGDAPVACDPGGTTLQMAACALEDLARAEAEMTQAFDAALDVAKAADASGHDGWEEETHLRLSQEAWIAYRDADCVVRTLEDSNGSIRTITYPACKADLTRARAADLRAIVGRSER